MQRTDASWRDRLEVIADRLKERRAALVVLAAAILVLLTLGELAVRWALVGAVALFAWTALWPLRARAPAASSTVREPKATTSLADPEAPLWQRMLEAMPDPALMLDQRRSVLAANASAQALFPDAAGRDIAHVHRAPELLAAVERAFGTGQPQPFDLHFVMPVEQHLTALAMPLSLGLDDPGSPAMVIILRDRTAEQQLAEMRADFVANASHELRTPLASLKGFIETLQGAAKDDPAARERFLPIMHEQASRMTRLIDDLLSLSRIEMHEHVPPSATGDVAEIVEGVGKSMQQIAAQKRQHLTVSLIEQPAPVVGDRDELAQVVQNLVQNAVKYGRPNGTIAVTVRREGPNIAVVVTDNGIGIAPEHLPRLTERFYRVSAKESRERGGTGLGLAIVKHIVNRHGGELKIASTLGKGSTFTVLLPAAREIL